MIQLAKDDEMITLDRKGATSSILAFTETYPNFEAVLLMDTNDGLVIAVNDKSALGIDISDRPYFQKAITKCEA